MSFEQFAIDPRCHKVLAAQQITTPSPVQEQAIPVALEGRDVVAIAQTGTGKTLGFTLPALTRLAQEKPGRNRMLVLTPTRELALQVHSVVEPFARALGMRSTCIYGGVGMGPQFQALKRGVDIVVATPGRLLDHVERGTIRFEECSVLVLDEADRMLDMGFMPDIQRIIKLLPKNRQMLMFSATFAKEIAALTSAMQNNPVRIVVGTIASPAESVRQNVYTVSQDGKMDLLSTLLRSGEVTSALVFLRTKHRTDRVAKALHSAGFKAQAIHGGRSQRQREQAIDGFREGRVKVLVATDVAARGIDVQGITHVFNFDIPKCHEDYIHRIGRTARANAEGDAITFVSPDDHRELGNIERELGRALPREEWEGSVHVASRYDQRGNGQSRPQQGRGGYQGRPQGGGRPQEARPQHQASGEGEGGGNYAPRRGPNGGGGGQGGGAKRGGRKFTASRNN